MKTKVGRTSTLANKVLMSKVFAKQAALQNPLEIGGMMGKGSNYAIQILNDELDQGGDQITFHVLNKFQSSGFDEGEQIEGFEEALSFYEDSVTVSTKDFAGRVDGPMDEQRTLLDLVNLTMENLQTQSAEWKSWLAITMLTGKVGTNIKILKATFNGWAGNPLVDIDTEHLMFGGDATSKATLDATDVFVIGDLVRLRDKANSLDYKVEPIKIKGKDYFLVLMHSNVWRDLRQANGNGSWFDVEKAMLQGGADPMTNGLINAAVGIRDGCILVVVDQCAVFEDYGAGSNVRASRVLFLGKQAAVWARGKKTQKEEWKFTKKKFQYDKETGICATTIGGCKAVIFASKRHGMLAMDVATKAAA